MKSDWIFPPLSDVAKDCRGSAIIKSSEKYELWSVPSFSEGAPEVVEGGEIRSAKRPVEPGDVLLCKINPRINRVWLVGPENGLEKVASTEWIVLRLEPSFKINPRWLQLYFSSPRFRNWMVGEISGATGSHTRAKPKEVMKQNIPLPPSDEQKRIVAILDEAFVGIDTVVANTEKNLANAREIFESYRDDIFGTQVDGWYSVELGELCTIKHGFAFKSDFFTSKGDYIVLTPGSFWEYGGFRDQGKKTKYYEGEIPDGYLLETGDFLFAMTEQAAGLLGSSLVVPESNRYLHNQRLGLPMRQRSCHPNGLRGDQRALSRRT